MLVGHTRGSLSADRTLRSLYIEPLHAILERQNGANGSQAAGWSGVFEAAPRVTLVLLLDFKTGGLAAWTAVQGELQPLREAGWLTHWDQDAANRVLRPLTVVVTGDVGLDSVTGQEDHDVFYDAPLADLGDGNYTAANSYYASGSMNNIVGKVHWGMDDSQIDTLQKQVKQAKEKDLVSRYWGTPSWPITVRNAVWKDLVENGVGVLNVDELSTATRWDWRFCTVLGLTICK